MEILRNLAGGTPGGFAAEPWNIGLELGRPGRVSGGVPKQPGEPERPAQISPDARYVGRNTDKQPVWELPDGRRRVLRDDGFVINESPEMFSGPGVSPYTRPGMFFTREEKPADISAGLPTAISGAPKRVEVATGKDLAAAVRRWQDVERDPNSSPADRAAALQEVERVRASLPRGRETPSAPSAPSHPLLAEIERLQSGPGNFVTIEDLRKRFPRLPDAEIFRLANQGKLVLGHYGGPDPAPGELGKYIKDPRGGDKPYYHAVALPREEAPSAAKPPRAQGPYKPFSWEGGKGIGPVQEGAAAKQGLDERITAVLANPANRDGNRVYLAKVRAALSDLTRKQQDAAIRGYRKRGVELYRNDVPRDITPDQHENAVQIGKEPRHFFSVTTAGASAESLRENEALRREQRATTETFRRLTERGGEPQASAQLAGKIAEDTAAKRETPSLVPAGATVGAERVPQLPVTRATVIGYERDMRLMESQKHGDMIQIFNDLKNPRDQAGNPLPGLMDHAVPLYQIGERNPNPDYGNLNPVEVRRFNDEWMLPEKEKLAELNVRNQRRARANPRFGEELAQAIAFAARPGFMPRINLLHAVKNFRAIARSLLGAEEFTGGLRGGVGGFGGGRFISPHQEGREFFALRSGDESKLMRFDRGVLSEVDGASKYSVTKEMRKQALRQQYGTVAKGLKVARELRKSGAGVAWAAERPVLGMKFKDKDGREWTLDDARTDEIHAKTNNRFIVNGPLAIKIAQADEIRMDREMRYLDGLQAKMMAEGHLSTRPFKDFRQTRAMGFKNLYVHPRVAAALDRFGPYNPEGGTPLSEYLANFNQFVTRSFMWNPVPHLRNVGTQWLINENAGLLDRRRMRSLMESWNDSLNQTPFFLRAVNEGGARLWGASEKAGKFYQYAEGELARTGGYKPIYSTLERLGNSKFNPWSWSHHTIALAQDTLMLDMIKARMRPVSEGGKGMSIREAANEANEVLGYDVPTELPFGQDVVPGRAGQALTYLSRIPAKASEEKLGRSAFNFVRWNYLKARLAYAPFFGTAKALYQRNPKLLAEHGSRIAAMLIAQQLIMPLGDNLVRKLTGDEKTRMTRWGSLAIIQAFDDALHGRATRQEALTTMMINLTPLWSLGYHGYEFLRGEKRYGKRMSLLDLGKAFLTQDIPLTSQVQRPFEKPQIPGSIAAETIFGVGKQPPTTAEEQQQEQMRRMMPRIPKPAKSPSPIPWLY